MDDAKLKFNAFVKGRSKSLDNDLDFTLLVDEFKKNGLYALIDNARSDSQDNGAYLFITGRQYILTLNAKHGQGSHALTAAKLYYRFMDKPCDTSFMGVGDASFNLENIPSCFHARIIYEYVGDNERGIPIFAGTIAFPLKNKKFNSQEIASFLQFYDDYAKEIESICKKYKMHVFFSHDSVDGKVVTNESLSLENVKTYILANRDDTIEDYFVASNIEEKIIGTEVNSNSYKR